MSTGRPSLNTVADALANLDAAPIHGYTVQAAYAAALDRLAGLDGDQLRETAAATAALFAWWLPIESWSHPPGPLHVAGWLQYTRCRVAEGDQP